MSSQMQIPNSIELAAVQDFFKSMSHADVLQFCCNINRSEFPNAPALADATVVICLDTEGWDASSEKLKEIGINTFDSRDMTALTSPGPWGENILRNVFFYFARIQKNAHLRNKNFSAGDPGKNRFGTARFLNDAEIIDCLTTIFEWPVDANANDGRLCPVVLLGHALDNDLEKLRKLLQFNPRTVVKEIDTQIIARDVGHWTHPSNQIGLQRLVMNMGFEHRDAHTASNDAAMTIIAAVQLILGEAYKGTKQPYSLQDVVDGLEFESQGHIWTHGSDKFCFRCGSRGHMAETGGLDGGYCRQKVFCEHCYEKRPGEMSHLGHRTEACVMKAYETSNSSRPRAARFRNNPPRTAPSRILGQSTALNSLSSGVSQLQLGGGPHSTTTLPPTRGRGSPTPPVMYSSPPEPENAYTRPGRSSTQSWSAIASQPAPSRSMTRRDSHTPKDSAPSVLHRWW